MDRFFIFHLLDAVDSKFLDSKIFLANCLESRIKNRQKMLNVLPFPPDCHVQIIIVYSLMVNGALTVLTHISPTCKKVRTFSSFNKIFINQVMDVTYFFRKSLSSIPNELCEIQSAGHGQSHTVGDDTLFKKLNYCESLSNLPL